MSKKKGQIVIRKSNRLVEAKYKLDIWETRVFTKALSMIRKDDDDLQTYRIYLSDMIEEFGLVKGQSYKYLKQAAKSLNKRTVILERETETGRREFQTNIVTGVDTAIDDHGDADSMYIEIDFHKNLKSSLLELKREFTTYNIQNVVNLPSAYSYRVYELLKQYQRITTRTFDLKELKERVGAIEFFGDDSPPVDHYPLYGNFRQKVLLKAQRDLKKYTDIVFSFEPNKRGRKVTGVTFFISQNGPEKKVKLDQVTPNSLFDRLYIAVKNWEDIDENSIKTLLSRYGKQRVLAAISQTQDDIKKGTIRGSVGKYFYGLVHNAPTLFEQRKDVIKDKSAKEAKKREREKRIRELEKRIHEYENQRELFKEKILLELRKENNPALDQAKDKVRRNRLYNLELDEDANLKKPSLRAVFWHELLQLLPTETYEIKQINIEVDRLKREKRF